DLCKLKKLIASGLEPSSFVTYCLNQFTLWCGVPRLNNYHPKIFSKIIIVTPAVKVYVNTIFNINLGITMQYFLRFRFLYLIAKTLFVLPIVSKSSPMRLCLMQKSVLFWILTIVYLKWMNFFVLCFLLVQLYMMLYTAAFIQISIETGIN
ncbi:hypothetical protein L9F63_014421, partial [Diploptera punctata]